MIEAPRRRSYVRKQNLRVFVSLKMTNVTISMDDDLALQIRVAAARAGKSVSKYLAEAGPEKLNADELAVGEGRRNLQKKALARILAGPHWDGTENGRMPTSEGRNARR
jgi:hypothetical protein